MNYKNIELKIEAKIAVLSFKAPEVLNAMSAPMVAEISHALDQVAKPGSGARCLLITGDGRAFCAGANLAAVGGESDAPVAGHVLETHYHPVMNKIRNLEIPVVTAVNGVAAGVGMSFALMGDMVLAAKSAYFLQAFAKIGLIPDGGATYLLPRLIGWGRALELSMLAEKLPAEKALDWGLVNRVVEDAELMTEAMAMAEKFANGPKSLGLIRKAYWESIQNGYAEQLQLESDLQTEAGRSKDSREGISAFLEKRSANFTGE